jgi:hypothetical protein
LGLFNLATGHLDHFIHGNWKEHDMGMIRSVIGWIAEKDVVVADRGFCGWGVMALLVRKNVDVVIRLHQCRDSSSRLTKWVRPPRRGDWGKCLWAELPDSLAVRIVRYQVVEAGFRTKEVALTTLTDKKKYPDEAIIALYGRRWQIELNLRDIKTTLRLDVLRCKTPELIAKEITMQAIAYNLVRGVMFKAARLAGLPLYRLSFKGTVDTSDNGRASSSAPTQKRPESGGKNCSLLSPQIPFHFDRSVPNPAPSSDDLRCIRNSLHPGVKWSWPNLAGLKTSQKPQNPH